MLYSSAHHSLQVPVASQMTMPLSIQNSEEKLKVAYCLQSSLDIHETFANFFQVAQQMVRCSGFEYIHKDMALNLALGTRRAHQAEYQLTLRDVSLGSLKIFRSQKFGVQDIETFESLLALFLLPLQNTLLYKQALNYSLQDPLTTIGNRGALEQTLQREFKLCDRSRYPLSLLIIDIDYFKQANDTYGHLYGDDLLKKIALSIQDCLRETDQLFRYGGDEFVLVLPNTDPEQALLVAERLRTEVIRLALFITETTRATLSIGIATKRDEDTLESLFLRSDQALYRAKEKGRNTATHFDY